jgi:hypothetical protein
MHHYAFGGIQVEQQSANGVPGVCAIEGYIPQHGK